jgi:hypothetical protein
MGVNPYDKQNAAAADHQQLQQLTAPQERLLLGCEGPLSGALFKS